MPGPWSDVQGFYFSDYLFKLLLIGDSGVGKSCLLLRFAVSVPPPPTQNHHVIVLKMGKILCYVTRYCLVVFILMGQ